MDELVLNLSVDDHQAVQKSGKKGGRWTDRLKAKRSVKRKRTSAEQPAEELNDEEPRPTKRVRISEKVPAKIPAAAEKPRAQTQIISSLFTSNPKIVTPAQAPAAKAGLPSNAPLSDSSSFAGLGLDPLLVAHLANKLDIAKPTSIQRAALSHALSASTSDRDIFIQSQTGSGKTLAFLLPIIQDLLPLSSLSYIDRSIGTLAVIIAPTRELAKQISDVLEGLLKLRLRPETDSAEDAEESGRLTRWLVSGLLIGGATRTHEKARLRKGVPILVSTPGRLLDHLQNTSSFNVGKCRWLVLDEADRLMELGFEESITGIIKGLNGRRTLARQAAEQGIGYEVGGWDWERTRRTILCSATIREDVQKLAGTTLVKPIIIKATEVDAPAKSLALEPASDRFTPPSQLSQKYVIVPLKLRLVVLIALLRSLISQSTASSNIKIIVFLSCTDSVDYHFNLLGGASMTQAEPSSETDEEEETTDSTSQRVEVKCALLPDTSVFRLHGSLPTHTRLASLKRFSASSASSPSILLCTSVASRGLDLPLVRAVIQYDLPTEGGATEYVHRVGRTARAGKGGQAWAIVAPSEAEWVKWIAPNMVDESAKPADRNVSLNAVSMESVLKDGFGGKGDGYEDRATEVQLTLERWVLSGKEHAEMARKAFLSHVRAYATHPSNEKHIFHIKHLHLGHLAKAFALRDAPKSVTGSQQKAQVQKDRKADGKHWETDHSKVAEKRMQEVVRSQGRSTKHKGVMQASGASEFQIASGYALEKMVGK
ncbi:P-loop containing nucleoside triphosphate hydrolase protein [Mycena floridula]|nr:P-loop containing nucleoside triphosphate hydrolase protein [Mycena floridula]